MYAHILVALDGSDNAEQILPYVESLAERFSSRVTLVQVTMSAEAIMVSTANSATLADTLPTIDPFPIAQAESEAVGGYLQKVAERLRERGLTVEHEQPDGPAADTLLARAQELKVDVIAMTTHGRTGLRRVVLGSTAQSVLNRAQCPMLLLRISGDR
jgi:nucleotide-binding universal stress UspA family protein